MKSLSWIRVEGGICEFGDRGKPITIKTLIWISTPLTRGQLGRDGAPELPFTSLNYGAALEVAQALGARLPLSSEWEWMAAGPERRLFPWGDTQWTPERANLRDNGIGAPSPVGNFPLGRTRDGLLDVAGNVWEWTSSMTLGDGAVIRGGSYNSPVLYARTVFVNVAPCELASPGIGLRLVREL